jgi:formylglycine-generating enzyme required for sulfatase activity
MKTRAMWVIGLVAAITFVLCFKKAPKGFVLIPAGSFQMGDAFEKGSSFPVHEEMVSAFFMEKFEVTAALWDEVRIWGASHGYTDLPAGAWKGATHPVHSINWYATVKWCNARSEREGLTPCYYKDAAQTVVYQTGNLDLDNTMVKWAANGYRLPTQVEWEKAARGGLSNKRFPWGDAISHQQANFHNSGKEPYQTGTVRFHPTYQTEKPGMEMYTSFTLSVGSFAPNEYGLYDMAGNVEEWCWDGVWNRASRSQGVPNGCYAPPVERIVRGGGWFSSAFDCRVAGRYIMPPAGASRRLGFRPVRGAIP